MLIDLFSSSSVQFLHRPSQWTRNNFLVFPKARSQLNEMRSHDIQDTVVFYSKKWSFKNSLSSLHLSHSRHKVTIPDYRNKLKHLPNSQGSEETCLTVISPANKIYWTKFNAIKHHEILRFTYLILSGICSSREKLSTVQNDRRGISSLLLLLNIYRNHPNLSMYCSTASRKDIATYPF